MLFVTLYSPRGNWTEEQAKRSLQLFAAWKVPAGVEVKAFYSRADGNGGIVIIESTSAAAILEAVAPWTSYFHYEISPIVDIAESVPIIARANAWRDSVG